MSHFTFLIQLKLFNVSLIVANIGALAMGISIGWSSPVQSQIQINNDGTCPHRFCVTPTQFAWIATCISIGVVIVVPFTAQLMKRLGRKKTLLIFTVPLITGWIFITTASSAVPLIIGRILIGSSGGSCNVLVPVYVGEISSPEIRGQLSSMFQIFINIGTVYTYVAGYFLSMFWMNVVCGAVGLVFAVGLCFIPESPRYDVSKSKLVKAKKSLKFLRGKNYDVDSEIQTILNAQAERRYLLGDSGNAMKKLLKDPVSRKSYLIILGLIFFFHTSGINVVLFYTADIMDTANVNLDPNLATIIVGIIFVVATLISAVLVDKLGRRPLLLVSTATLTACYILMGTYFLLQENGTSVDSLTWAPVVLLSVFVAAFSLGIGPITWIMMGELLDQSVKDVAVGFAIMFGDSTSIVVLLLFPYLTTVIGDGWTFLIFSSFTALAFVFIAFFVPETKGRSLEEIQRLLQKNN